METHPPHVHHTSEKKFSNYFYEFLMLFLAVFCGFLAENLREANVEKHREIQYIKSMIEDLKKDTGNISIAVKEFEVLSYSFDTVLNNFDRSVISFSQPWSNSFVRIIKKGYPDYYYTDRTLQQLKNSGGMRLIKNQIVSNQIVDYDDANKDFITEDGFLTFIQQKAFDTALRMWSFKRVEQKTHSTKWGQMNVPEGDYWIIRDIESLEYLFNIISQFHRSETFQKTRLLEIQVQAVQLIETLNKEYKLD